MDKKFYSEWAVYNGQKYRRISYGNGMEKLFGTADVECKNPLYTVNKADLDEKYSEMICAILNGIKYVVYGIDEGVAEYKRHVSSADFLHKNIGDFDMVYLQRNYGDRTECETISINTAKIDEISAHSPFRAEETASGNLELSCIDRIISPQKFLSELETLYADRIAAKKTLAQEMDVDFMQQIFIDGIEFCFTYSWGITALNAKNTAGNRYILEIAEHFRKTLS